MMCCLLYTFFIVSIFSQQDGQSVFVKRIENNFYFHGPIHPIANLKSKGEIEKLFFGDFNAPVEFSYLPAGENAAFRPPSGFRIVRDSLRKSYILEVKYVSNYAEASEMASMKYPSIASGSEWAGMPEDRRKQIINHNRAAFAKQQEERLALLKIESSSIPISNQFAEKLYQKMVSFIDTYKAKGVGTLLVDDNEVVFRNVVGHEVWSLSIIHPRDVALKMTDLCNQIVTDARANKLVEKKYISALH